MKKKSAAILLTLNYNQNEENRNQKVCSYNTNSQVKSLASRAESHLIFNFQEYHTITGTQWMPNGC